MKKYVGVRLLVGIVALWTEGKIVSVGLIDFTKFCDVRFTEYISIGDFPKQIDSNDAAFNEQQLFLGKQAAMVSWQSKLRIWEHDKTAVNSFRQRSFLAKLFFLSCK